MRRLLATDCISEFLCVEGETFVRVVVRNDTGDQVLASSCLPISCDEYLDLESDDRDFLDKAVTKAVRKLMTGKYTERRFDAVVSNLRLFDIRR